MKKIKILFFFVLCMFAFNASIFAVCNDEELNDWAEKVKISLERDEAASYYVTDENGESTLYQHEVEYYYKLLICEPRDDIYIKATDSENTKEYDATYSEYDNSFIVGSKIHFSTKNYVIKIYGSSNSSCSGELLRTIKYSVPAYNKLQETIFCQDNPNDKLCQVETNTNDYTNDEILDHISNVEEENKVDTMTTSEKILYYIGKYWYFVVAPIVIISVIYIVKIVKLKKKGDKE